MSTLPLTAEDVYAPTTAEGAPRALDMGEGQAYHMSLEAAVVAMATLLGVPIDTYVPEQAIDTWRVLKQLRAENVAWCQTLIDSIEGDPTSIESIEFRYAVVVPGKWIWTRIAEITGKTPTQMTAFKAACLAQTLESTAASWPKT